VGDFHRKLLRNWSRATGFNVALYGSHPFPQVKRYDDSLSQRLVPYLTIIELLFFVRAC